MESGKIVGKLHLAITYKTFEVSSGVGQRWQAGRVVYVCFGCARARGRGRVCECMKREGGRFAHCSAHGYTHSNGPPQVDAAEPSESCVSLYCTKNEEKDGPCVIM